MRTDPRATLPAFYRTADISNSEGASTVDLIFSTGAKVRRYSWLRDEEYDEELVLTPEAVRMGRLNAGAPLLDSHSRWSLEDVIGRVVSAEVRDGKGYATIQLSDAPADADRVRKIRDGVVRNVSVGYVIHRVERTPGDPDAKKIAQWRVVDWEPIEISAVPVPADPGAQFRSAEAPQSTCVFVTRDDPAAVTEMREQPVTERTDAAAGERAEQTAVDATAQRNMDDATRAAADVATREERERANTIRRIAEPFNLRDLADRHIADGTTVIRFREIAMDELATRNRSDDPTTSTTRVDGPSQAERRAAGIENALLHRSSPIEFALTADGRDFMGMSLIELARDSLEVAGIRTRGMPKTEIAQRALALGSVSIRAAGLMATTDFPNILANVANKSLRAAYDAAPQTFRPLVTVTTLPDFKEVSRVQLGEAPQLDKVAEHGEFTYGSIGEGAEKYSIATYGKIVAITRQVIINDDLNAFTRIPRNFGNSAAQLESDLVWAQIIGNPTMGNDNTALFHANHKNLAASGAAISVDTISAGRLAMSTQTGLDGRTVLNIMPVSLIVPVAKLTAAEQFLYGAIYPTTPAGATPPSLQRLTPMSEPRLDNGIPRFGIAGSATAWYLAASPAQIDLVELAYLEGNQGVYTETRVGFEVDGVEVKVRLDVGAKIIDFRGVYKNAGA